MVLPSCGKLTLRESDSSAGNATPRTRYIGDEPKSTRNACNIVGALSSVFRLVTSNLAQNVTPSPIWALALPRFPKYHLP